MLNRVDYYALGPWENTCDRRDGVLAGRYSTTVADMPDRYIKPQSTGGREALRELVLSDGKGFGVKIETEGPWECIQRVGDDIILIDKPFQRRDPGAERKRRKKF